MKRKTVAWLMLLFAGPWLPFPASLSAQSGPVNLNFEQGNPGEAPPGWWGKRPGYAAGLTQENPAGGSMCAFVSSTSTTPPGDFGVLSQSFDAEPFRGKVVRFRAAVRAEVSGGENHAQLWMRVDRPNGQFGYFDNMEDRPVTSPEWRYYEIIGSVAPDATNISMGLILSGLGTAWIDNASFEILALEPPRPLTSRGLENVVAFTHLLGYIRHFHPSDEAAATDWNRFAVEGMQAVESAGTATELVDILDTLFHPIAPTLKVFRTGQNPSISYPEPPPGPNGPVQVVAWEYEGYDSGEFASVYRSRRTYTSAAEGKIPDDLADYREPYQAELGGGASCSFPMALFADSSGTWPHGTMPDQTASSYSGRDRWTRLAATALAWNVFQHFYPYFDVVDTDWPAVLASSLKSAATDADEVEFLDTLRRLVAALHDGHGGVYNTGIPTPGYGPPFAWDWIEGHLVVTRVLNEGATIVRPGDVVRSINGKAAGTALEEVESFVSGATPQWIRYRGLQELYRGEFGESMTLEIEPRADAEKRIQTTVSLCTPVSDIAEARPWKISELEPGIFYLDLNEITDADFLSVLPQLEQAKGIIFDMRGYPHNMGPQTLFSHIIERPVTSARWNIPVVRFPDRKGLDFYESRWNYIQPQAPFLKARKAFITDGRAISYAESCMGIVEAYQLAEIVGGPTAGTNGNVDPFTVAGGYRFSWTGMKVTKHDGSRHHGVGILPTVPAARTKAGAAAEVDELLQRATQIVSPSPSLQVQLPGEGAASASTVGAGAPVRAGYAVAQVKSGGAPYGVAVYTFRNSEGVVVSEAAVPVSPPTTSARILVDNASAVSMTGRAADGLVGVDTGIALVNLGSADANLILTLRDKAGTVLAHGQGTIGAAAHIARFVDQLNEIAPDFVFPEDFSTGVRFGSLEIASDQPLSLTALRMTVNQRGETLMTSTPVADLTREGTGLPLYFPQLADGGGYRTTLVLLNTSAAIETGKLAFYGNDGRPVIIEGMDAASGSTFPYSIQPGGTFVFQTAGSALNASVSWAQVTPEEGSASPVGAGVFSFSQDGILVTESGIPSAPLTTHARIYVDQSANLGTGLAIANPGLSDASITLAANERSCATLIRRIGRRAGCPRIPGVHARRGTATSPSGKHFPEGAIRTFSGFWIRTGARRRQPVWP